MNMMTSGERHFSFFEKQTPTWIRPVRTRRNPDDLPDELKGAILNPKLAVFLSRAMENLEELSMQQEGGFQDIKASIARGGTRPSTAPTGKRPTRPVTGIRFVGEGDQNDMTSKKFKKLARHTLVTEKLKGAIPSLRRPSSRLRASVHLAADRKRKIMNSAVDKWKNALADRRDTDPLSGYSLFDALGYVFERISDNPLDLPKDLMSSLSSNYKDLTHNVKVEKRDWQLEEKRRKYGLFKNKQQQQETADKAAIDAALEKLAEANKPAPVPTKKATNKKKQQKEDDETKGEDNLTVPENVQKTSSSSTGIQLAPQASQGKTKTTQKGPSEGKGKTTPIPKDKENSSLPDDFPISKEGYYAVMQFQLSNKYFEKLGWLTEPLIAELKGAEPEIILRRLKETLQKSVKDRNDAQDEYNRLNYTKTTAIVYAENTRKDIVNEFKLKNIPQPGTPILKGANAAKPPIPTSNRAEKLKEFDKNKKLQKLYLHDGSELGYYPSGRLAFMMVPLPFQPDVRYCYIFDDSTEKKLLGFFGPQGRGYVQSQLSQENIIFGASKLYRCRYETVGKDQRNVIESTHTFHRYSMIFKPPIDLQINRYMSVKFHHATNIILMVNWGEAKALRLKFGLDSSAENEHVSAEIRLAQEGKLQFPENLTSKFARQCWKEKVNAVDSKDENAKGRGRNAKRPSLAPDQKSHGDTREDFLQGKVGGPGSKLGSMSVGGSTGSEDADEKTCTEEEIMQDYHYLTKRTQEIISDWLKLYTSALHLGERRRFAPTPLPKKIGRIKSAKQLSREGESSASSPGRITPTSPTSAAVVMEEVEETKAIKVAKSRSKLGLIPTDSFIKAMIEELDEPHTLSWEDPHARITLLPPLDVLPSAATKNNRTLQCPPSLRDHLLGFYTHGCNCRASQMPRITDVEFDVFIRKYAPPRQLIVVGIKSSRFPDPLQNPLMVERLYEHQVGNRGRPCLLGMKDPVRYLWYDVDIAPIDTNEKTSLLQRRHRVVPGMFLIYCGGRLLFCDHIFNGYGTELEDFLKQIELCRELARTDHYLPFDFKFKYMRGRHGLRSSWGGEIGGVYYRIHKESLEIRGSSSSVQFEPVSPMKLPPISRSPTRQKKSRPSQPVFIDHPPYHRAVIHSGRPLIGYIRPSTTIGRMTMNQHSPESAPQTPSLPPGFKQLKSTSEHPPPVSAR